MDLSDIARNLAHVRGQIEQAAMAAGRDRGAVTLVAVSKTHPAEAIEEAIAQGQRVFGENRVQEAKAKFPDLKTRFPDLRLHLIGPLQTNKVREAVALADVIETVDRPKLARVIAEEAKRIDRAMRVLIQVNIGREPQKAGVDPDQVDALVGVCRDQFGLLVEGLMCIPPADQDPAPHFRRMAEMAARNGLKTLSMGMSGDYAAAIAAGATHVRVGTAIFGHRDYPAA